MLIEEWKEVFSGYFVSTLGRVRHYQTELKGSISCNGYKQVFINGKQRRIHLLVAKAFMENIEGKNQINHIDGDKQNNRVDNLEYVSNAENNSVEKKINRNTRKIKVKDLTSGAVFNSICECAKVLGVNEATVRSVVHGYRKSVKGHSLTVWN